MPRTTILRRLVDATRPAPTTTLRRHVLVRVRSAVVCFTMFAAAYVGVLALTGSSHGVIDIETARPDSPAAPQVVRAHEREIELAERLVERHGCWTGDAPADVTFPGGVVLAELGDRPRFYGSDEIVGDALEHLFTAPNPTIVAVFGFCR